MKTHRLAKVLESLAAALYGGPDVELRHFEELLQDVDEVPRSIRKVDPDDAALSLSALAALSKFTKAEWRQLIADWGLPIEIPAAYSARDTIGKLLRYLEDHPDAMKRLHRERAAKSRNASPELLKTLSLLIGDKQ